MNETGSAFDFGTIILLILQILFSVFFGGFVPLL